MKTLLVLFLAASCFTSLHAGVYVFNPLQAQITPVPPPVILTVLDSPLVPFNITKRSNNTIYWSDFEQTSPDWLARGGSWWISGSGHKGGGVSGQDNNGGIGGASQYYLNLALSSYVGFYVGVKIRYAGTGWAGIVLINNNLNRLYEISINPSGASARLNIWSYNVESLNGWSQLASSPNFSYTDQWYTLIVRYQYSPTSIVITAEVYSENGVYLTSVSATSTSNRRFPAQYVGLEIDGGSAMFDDFVISKRNPAYLNVTGLSPNASARLYDSNGSLVGEGLSDVNGIAMLSVVKDLVTGVGDGGVLQISSNNTSCSVKTSIPLIGGEDYLVSSTKAFEGYADPTYTGATVFFYINSSDLKLSVIQLYSILAEEFEVSLILESIEAVGEATFNITLESSSTSSYPIMVVNGEVISPRTSTLTLRDGGLKITVSGLFFRSVYTAKLSVEYCFSSKSVCVSYPLILYGLGGGEP
ncbi:hypothetical protein IMZ38_03930 [Thermosphaera chiliense]|uniref:Uncharacterized protein n=1 Tax=Thermosphaera chiliense TaxID=3402707 RepID=A0A7M1UNK6_9CREN|nr:hypothetical protein [Thermosphaera aggregans]QOR93810.1 hypothetical protein IMZ38_03930 [Thermosphaera aggregans]